MNKEPESPVDQRRLVPLVLAQMELPISLVSVLISLKQPLCLCFSLVCIRLGTT
jgi:hypothetical protein